jgi:hypothetical protein
LYTNLKTRYKTISPKKRYGTLRDVLKKYIFEYNKSNTKAVVKNNTKTVLAKKNLYFENLL